MDMKTVMILMVAMSMTACSVMPTSARMELEHVSHPLAGWPVSANNTEDALSQVSVIGHWQSGRVYVENGLGWNLQGADGAGFKGPGLTYTGRIGIQFWSR
jgi:hypothetical protein